MHTVNWMVAPTEIMSLSLVFLPKHQCSMATPAPLGPAIAEAIYKDPPAVKDALQAHAAQNGHSIFVQSSSERRVFYICSKGDSYDGKGKDLATHESKRRKNISTTKTDCKHRYVARKLMRVGSLRSWITTTTMVQSQHFLPCHSTELLQWQQRNVRWFEICLLSIIALPKSSTLSARRIQAQTWSYKTFTTC